MTTLYRKGLNKSEKEAINSYAKELIAQGIDSSLAKVMAKAMFDSKLIQPVTTVREFDVINGIAFER